MTVGLDDRERRDLERAIEHCDKILTSYQGLSYKIPLAHFTFAMTVLYALWTSERPFSLSPCTTAIIVAWLVCLNACLSWWQWLLFRSCERHRETADRYIKRLSGAHLLLPTRSPRDPVRGTGEPGIWQRLKSSMWLPVLALPWFATAALIIGVLTAS